MKVGRWVEQTVDLKAGKTADRLDDCLAAMMVVRTAGWLAALWDQT